jgi:hypothetical protein
MGKFALALGALVVPLLSSTVREALAVMIREKMADWRDRRRADRKARERGV